MVENSYIKDRDVSIIVPLFHGEKYMDNILQMTRRNVESASDISIELILVNDSPDDLPDFSKTKNTSYQTHIVLNEKNLGIQGSRLQGVEHSCGKYLFFMDQDDVVSDDTIIRLYKAACGGEISVSDWELELADNDGIYSVDRIANTKEFTIKKMCIQGNIIGPPACCLIRRDCLPVCWTKRIMKINGADDVLLWMGMLAEGRKFQHCDEKLYVHKLHPECFSNDTLNILASEDEAFNLAASEYGIPEFWQVVHKQSIRYRRLIYIASQHNCDYKFIKRICLLLFPALFSVRMLNKVGINVG